MKHKPFFINLPLRICHKLGQDVSWQQLPHTLLVTSWTIVLILPLENSFTCQHVSVIVFCVFVWETETLLRKNRYWSCTVRLQERLLWLKGLKGHLHYITFDFSRVLVGLLCSFLPVVKSIKSISGDNLQLGNKGHEKEKSTYR